jgi:hypothetical protein
MCQPSRSLYRYSRNASGTTNIPLLSLRVTFLTLQRLRTREIISGGRLVQLPERTEANVWQGQCRGDRGWGASGGCPPAALRRRIPDRGLVPGRPREGLACSMRSATHGRLQGNRHAAGFGMTILISSSGSTRRRPSWGFSWCMTSGGHPAR